MLQQQALPAQGAASTGTQSGDVPGAPGAPPTGSVGGTGASGVSTDGGAVGARPSAGAVHAGGASGSGAAAGTGPAVAVTAGPLAPIIVGNVGNYSGPAGSSDGMAPVALHVWGQWVNAHGGIAGHPVQVFTADDGGDPARSRSLIQDMLENKHVIAFVGNSLPLDVDAGIGYLEQKHIPVVGGDLTAIFEGLYALKNETLGGLTPPLNYASHQPSPPVTCYHLAKISGGRWTALGSAYQCL